MAKYISISSQQLILAVVISGVWGIKCLTFTLLYCLAFCCYKL